MNPTKPGYQTSEFWASIIALAMGVLVSLHAVPAGDSATVMGYLNAIVTSAIAMGGPVVLLWRYIESRIALKKAAAAGK